MKDPHKLSVREADGGAIILVKVVPGSSRDRIVGVLGGALKITTAAPAEKGKANAAVTGILAKALGVDRSSIRIVGGAGSPHKRLQCAGLSGEKVRERLQDPGEL